MVRFGCRWKSKGGEREDRSGGTGEETYKV